MKYILRLEIEADSIKEALDSINKAKLVSIQEATKEKEPVGFKI